MHVNENKQPKKNVHCTHEKVNVCERNKINVHNDSWFHTYNTIFMYIVTNTKHDSLKSLLLRYSIKMKNDEAKESMR